MPDCLFADRTSTATMRANQLRLWLSSFAYVLVCALRRIALKHTQFAKANCATIRLKLLKIGALVRISVRRIKLAMASSFPHSANTGSPTSGLPPRRADEPDSAQSHSPVQATFVDGDWRTALTIRRKGPRKPPAPSLQAALSAPRRSNAPINQ